MSNATTSRGYRNRNPGNIDFHERNRWQGQVGLGDDWLPANMRRFAKFESHEFGIRALAALLTTYQDRHGLRTVRQIINRWAPPSGSANGRAYTQSTQGYVQHVTQLTGFAADEPLDLHRFEHMRKLLVAIITHEIGGQPYADAVIDEGLRRAGLVRPVETMRAAAATGTGQGAAGVAGAVAAAAPAAGLVTALGDLSPWVAAALIAAAAVLALAWILAQRKDRPA